VLGDETEHALVARLVVGVVGVVEPRLCHRTDLVE
jgi:hypothetical protein